MADRSAAAPPAGDHVLDVASLPSVPRFTGVYAAWLVNSVALADAGIGGEAPLLLYVTCIRSNVGRRMSNRWCGVTTCRRRLWLLVRTGDAATTRCRRA